MFETKQENSVGLLKLLTNRTTYSKYRSLIKEYVLDSESNGILQDLGAYFEAYPTHDAVDWATFFTWSRTTRRATMSPSDRVGYEANIKKVQDAAVPDELTVGRFVELDYAGQIGGIVDNVLEGKAGATLDQINTLLTEYTTKANPTRVEVVP